MGNNVVRDMMMAGNNPRAKAAVDRRANILSTRATNKAWIIAALQYVIV